MLYKYWGACIPLIIFLFFSPAWCLSLLNLSDPSASCCLYLPIWNPLFLSPENSPLLLLFSIQYTFGFSTQVKTSVCTPCSLLLLYFHWVHLSPLARLYVTNQRISCICYRIPSKENCVWHLWETAQWIFERLFYQFSWFIAASIYSSSFN